MAAREFERHPIEGRHDSMRVLLEDVARLQLKGVPAQQGRQNKLKFHEGHLLANAISRAHEEGNPGSLRAGRLSLFGEPLGIELEGLRPEGGVVGDGDTVDPEVFSLLKGNSIHSEGLAHLTETTLSGGIEAQRLLSQRLVEVS